MGKAWIYVILLVFGDSIFAHPIPADPSVHTEFLILHNNDIHARFEQSNKNGGVCSQNDAARQKCFGGFARVAHELRKYRNEAGKGGTPVLFMNAGDIFSGTAWFSVFKNQIASVFLNQLRPDVISLGNHEFDTGIEGLVPFLKAVESPVVVSNMDFSLEPDLVATNKLSNSTILEVNGTKIGIIGYLTPKTKEDYINKVEFRDEVSSINAEAKVLNDQGVNVIIALGHSGYHKDQDIARNCPEVDIVIGGHSHTYLDANKPVANKDDPNPEAVRGPYPTIVEQPSGKKVPVVQVYTNTKYLGKLRVQFDAEGNLISFEGTPILLDSSVPQEQDILNLLDTFRPNITARAEQVVGRTLVHLEGGNVCRMRECNLGNLITDSMIYARILEKKGGEYWTDAPIAMLAGGGVRTSIDKNKNGTITFRDIGETIPFENRLFVTRVTGKTLRTALERSATVRTRDSNGGFQQLSGIQVVYDYNNEEGNRVVSVMVRCAECTVPFYSHLDDSAHYKIVVTDFLLNGGDGFEMVEAEDPFTEMLNLDDIGALQSYLESRHFIYPDIEGRIVIRQPEDT